MIKIRAENCSKYAFLLCALCGEMLKDDMKRMLGEERFARKTVQKAREDGLLSEKKTPIGRFVKLTKSGYEQISKIPPLKEHYDVLTKKHSFSSDKATLQRRASTAKTILAFVENDIPIDGIRLTMDSRPGRKKAPPGVNDTVLNPVIGKELFTGTSHVYVTYETEKDFRKEQVGSFLYYARDIAGRNAVFFPSNISKRHREGERSTAGNMNATRSKGQLFGGGVSYTVFHMDKDPISTPAQNELRYAEYMLDVYENIYGPAAVRKLSSYGKRGKAIILGGSSDLLSSFILTEEDRLLRNSTSSKIVLPEIYSELHILSNTKNGIKLLKNPNWEENLLREFYLPRERQKARSAGAGRHVKAVIEKNGRQILSVPLFSLDVIRINDTISEILALGEPVHILCPCEYEKQITEIYEGYDAYIEAIEMEV